MTDSDPELIAQIRRQLAADSPRVDTDAAWARLNQRIQADEATVGQEGPSRLAPRRRSVPVIAWRIAATIAILAGGTTIWQQWQASRITTLVAPLATTTSVTLPDGTKTILAPGSQLSWRRDFGRRERTVTLVGEGYFDVVHDDASPFTVRARHAIARDIGTRFTVRAWEDLADVEVAVEEGVVALGDTAATPRIAPTSLIAGQRGRIAGNGATQVLPGIGSSLAWISGELVFDNMPLVDALVVMSRWYDVDLQATPALAGARVTARFARQPLPDLLQSLSLALRVRAQQTGRVITLTPAVE